MAMSVIIYEKENKQKDYKFIAKDMNGKWVIGWVVIEQPWYSQENDWTYYIVRNQYGRGICGGASDLGLEKIIVDKNTIMPFTQKAEIQYDLDNGMTVRVDRKFYCFDEDAPKDNVLALIRPGECIPELWQ